jgi:hypothetical protein
MPFVFPYQCLDFTNPICSESGPVVEWRFLPRAAALGGVNCDPLSIQRGGVSRSLPPRCCINSMRPGRAQSGVSHRGQPRSVARPHVPRGLSSTRRGGVSRSLPPWYCTNSKCPHRAAFTTAAAALGVPARPGVPSAHPLSTPRGGVSRSLPPWCAMYRMCSVSARVHDELCP